MSDATSGAPAYRHSASLRAFTPVFDGLWTRVNALVAHAGYSIPAFAGMSGIESSVRRHGHPDRRFSREPHPLQHHLVGNVERLQVDVVIILALEDVAVRPAARTDQHRAGEAHVHVVGEQLREIAHARIEAIAIGLLALDFRDPGCAV